ncbi:hypothetical protein HNP52_001255 [Sphingomonas kyeonggiensis]|uniref:EF-hand domain-containing protein n=1 Tax=Sphingomonas kyeonggiensis TaxID=1268553 RepID=A0A7W7NS22_9SPHN|nr:hypothetical protein [Sphingomonas kyeonggiensis]MBB4838204.1 hypothetical protein [Sphingomonas kyeonggiensis]
MTGPIRARRAGALAGMLMLCGCAIGRAALDVGSAALVARFDADRDGGLDRAEVAAMVSAAMPGSGPTIEAARAGLAAGYWTRDCDRDGKLTAGELAAGGRCGG